MFGSPKRTLPRISNSNSMDFEMDFLGLVGLPLLEKHEFISQLRSGTASTAQHKNQTFGDRQR